MKYNFKKIEKKWQKKWEKEKLYEVKENPKKDKFYCLIEFPYPSGEGLHVGHPRSYTALDIVARKKRMEGKNVLYPIGWDAFGLPTENYAIKTGIQPAVATEKNIKNFTRQLKSLGFSFDWSREINTTDPGYYKWTQWMFLQFFKHGLAYKDKIAINWCPKDKIGLANEEVVDGKCERCGTPVEKRMKEQWMLKITKYAERLLQGLENVDYSPRIKEGQINWIGRSEGATVKFDIKHANRFANSANDNANVVEVFTTRPDTLFGATYMVLAPEHPIVQNLKSKIKNLKEVEEYIEKAKKKSDLERQESKDKTGVKLKGIKAINPVNNEKIPVWVADYVLTGYGTGAIMAVPAHDQRDHDFAVKYGLPIVEVIQPKENINEKLKIKNEKLQLKIKNFKNAYEDDGILINSEKFNGMASEKARWAIVDWLAESGLAQKAVHYKLRDWVFSRQRYWGEPIPLVYCEQCAKRKPKILVIHGLGGNPQENWFPWFKKQMESHGFEVIIPDLPKPENLYLKDWLSELGKLGITADDDLFVVGHSLGGPTACQFILKNNLPVKKLILVAPVGKSSDWQQLRKFDFSDDEIATITRFGGASIDFSKLKSLVADSVLYFSKDDPYISLNIQDDYKDLNGTVRIFEDKKHFSSRWGTTELPEILEEFPNNLNTGWAPVPEKDLPVELPKVKKYEPTDTGESPLAVMEKWVATKCPRCGGPARRETDTMPNWAGSSWYFLRYADPKNKKEFAGEKSLKYWMGGGSPTPPNLPSGRGGSEFSSPPLRRGVRGGVDWYNGGMEHTTLHLLYSRFWYKFLYDIGTVPKECGDEPYKKRTSHGLILGEGGEKMSKSRGNVVNPDDIVARFGADTMRVYEMFMGPFEQAIPWDEKGVVGVFRFLERIWRLSTRINLRSDTRISLQMSANKFANDRLERLLHQTIKKVSEDIEQMKFNTAVSALMILTNEMAAQKELPITNYQLLITLLAPFAPHLAEELWEKLGNKKSVHLEKWPEYNPAIIIEEEIDLVVQVNGKARDTIRVKADIGEEEAKKVAMKSEKVKKWIEGKKIRKIIFVKGRLVNIVV
jgi:leucyl-tRNA synthetase